MKLSLAISTKGGIRHLVMKCAIIVKRVRSHLKRWTWLNTYHFSVGYLNGPSNRKLALQVLFFTVSAKIFLFLLFKKPRGDFYLSFHSTETHWRLAQRWPYQSSSAWHKVSCKTASWCMRIDSGFSPPRRLPQRRFSFHAIQHYQLSPLRFGDLFSILTFNFPLWNWLMSLLILFYFTS